MQFALTIERVRSFLHTRGMELLETRAPVATPAELAPLASRLGGSLPPFLTELYSSFAGGYGFGWRNADSSVWGSCQLFSPAVALEALERFNPLHSSEGYLQAVRNHGKPIDEDAVKRIATRMNAYLPMWTTIGSTLVVIDCADPQGVVLAAPHLGFVERDRVEPVVVAEGLEQFLLRHAAVSFQHPAQADWAGLRNTETGAWNRRAFDPDFINPEFESHLGADSA